jgi:RNA polymerase sigma factor (sigma-70 family)
LVNDEDIWDLSDKEDIERDADVSLRLEGVKEYLGRLKTEQREIVVLRVWEGMSYKEIAEATGRSEDSCKMMFSRTIRRLRDEMPLGLFLCLLFFNI